MQLYIFILFDVKFLLFFFIIIFIIISCSIINLCVQSTFDFYIIILYYVS
jgi:hypothetical protein